jgi:peptidoglycan hydrolase CwlO-like protein
LNAKINELMQEIQNREAKIAQRDNTIHDLQAEIERLNQINQQAGASGSELQSKLAET